MVKMKGKQMSNIDLNKYQHFVDAVTSKPSNNVAVLIQRLHDLSQEPDLNISLLMTASIGLASEGGEFSEIVKKMVFQGKPFNEENRFHMFRELGDILWYWVNACRALGYDPNEVIAENVRKLESRYPGGQFDPYYSENRKSNDL
jgi:NTP pyrophosphatase (non-canonical NTP hydrolase)